MVMENEELIAEIKKWAYERVNPMFTIYPVVRLAYPEYYRMDSTYPEYRRVYRILEKMVKSGVLMAHGTVNGGNVYMLRSRDVKNGDIPF